MTTGLSIRFRSLLVIAAWSAVSLTPLATAQACHACLAPAMTLTEQLASADLAVLVRFIGAEKERVVPANDFEGGTETLPGGSTYRIQQVMKGPKSLARDQKIHFNYYSARKVGDLFVLMGQASQEGQGHDWSSPLQATPFRVSYLIQAPSPEAPAQERLAYFCGFLDSPDPTISDDAFTEFSNAQHEDIEKFADQLPREKLWKWITNPETPGIRLSLYGLMLGLCGTAKDAELLEARIRVQTDEYRLGMDGLMGGYLLLTGEKGLDVLDEHKLSNKNSPFSETFAAMQAVRFMWSHGNGKIAPKRLQQSMRILLDRSDLADWVIADLARWKDWSILDKLMAMYGQGQYNTRAIKRAIARYMLASSKDISSGKDAPHIVYGLKLLNELRSTDPKTVSEIERFFGVP